MMDGGSDKKKFLLLTGFNFYLQWKSWGQLDCSHQHLFTSYTKKNESRRGNSDLIKELIGRNLAKYIRA
jgi:hypothetical protein